MYNLPKEMQELQKTVGCTNGFTVFFRGKWASDTDTLDKTAWTCDIHLWICKPICLNVLTSSTVLFH